MAVNEVITSVLKSSYTQKLFLPFPFGVLFSLLKLFIFLKKVHSKGTAASVPAGAIVRYVVEGCASVTECRCHARAFNKALAAEKIFCFLPEERALNK